MSDGPKILIVDEAHAGKEHSELSDQHEAPETAMSEMWQ